MCMATPFRHELFPSDHARVRNFVDALSRKFGRLFEPTRGLKWASRNIPSPRGPGASTTDATTSRAAFFFFKDGTQILYFYRGLAARNSSISWS